VDKGLVALVNVETDDRARASTVAARPQSYPQP
jgi:hypothetical protein